MYTNTILAALVAAPVAVSALGNAIIKNQCSEPVYMWSVSNDNPGVQHTIAAGGSYSEAYYTPSSGGVSMKISKQSMDNAYAQVAITQFEYTLEGMIWYDISNINGYPFMSSGVTLIPGESSCPTKTCPAGIPLCGDAYNTPTEDDATGACSAESDTTLVLCSGGSTSNPVAAKAPVAAEKVAAPKVAAAKPAVTSAPAASSAPAAKPAAPMTTVAAAIPVVESAPDAGVFTTFVTQIITIAVRDAAPEPTAVPMKRDEATLNMQKRAAHRHHFHRHGADAE